MNIQTDGWRFVGEPDAERCELTLYLAEDHDRTERDFIVFTLNRHWKQDDVWDLFLACRALYSGQDEATFGSWKISADMELLVASIEFRGVRFFIEAHRFGGLIDIARHLDFGELGPVKVRETVLL